MRYLKTLLVLYTGVSLSGCLHVLPDPKPAKTVYALDNTERSWVSTPDSYSIRIDTPVAPNVLMNKDIVVTGDGISYSVLGDSQWVENLPNLIQISFQDIINEKENMIGVLPVTGARTDYRISLVVRDFEARFDNGENQAPLIIVKYSATMANAATRELMGTFEVKKTQRAQAATVSSIVRAMGDANEAALSGIVEWMDSMDLSRLRKGAVFGR